MSSILNNRPFTIVLRQGTAANLAAADTYLTAGEPAYTTDTKSLYIGDGTNKNYIAGGGYSGTITTAKLTTGGTTGSMTFVNGVLISQVAAT
jgi:hypothetical protein